MSLDKKSITDVMWNNLQEEIAKQLEGYKFRICDKENYLEEEEEENLDSINQ